MVSCQVVFVNCTAYQGLPTKLRRQNIYSIYHIKNKCDQVLKYISENCIFTCFGGNFVCDRPLNVTVTHAAFKCYPSPVVFNTEKFKNNFYTRFRVGWVINSNHMSCHKHGGGDNLMWNLHFTTDYILYNLIEYVTNKITLNHCCCQCCSHNNYIPLFCCKSSVFIG